MRAGRGGRPTQLETAITTDTGGPHETTRTDKTTGVMVGDIVTTTGVMVGDIVTTKEARKSSRERQNATVHTPLTPGERIHLPPHRGRKPAGAKSNVEGGTEAIVEDAPLRTAAPLPPLLEGILGGLPPPGREKGLEKHLMVTPYQHGRKQS